VGGGGVTIPRRDALDAAALWANHQCSAAGVADLVNRSGSFSKSARHDSEQKRYVAPPCSAVKKALSLFTFIPHTGSIHDASSPVFSAPAGVSDLDAPGVESRWFWFCIIVMSVPS